MISVVIPSHNRKKNVELVLTGLLNQTLSKEHFEVILVDDGSTDKTYELVEVFKDELRLKYAWIFKKDNWNASRPRNFGAKLVEAESEAFLFLDSDVVLNKQALKHYSEELKKEKRVIIGRYDWLPPQIVTPEDITDNWDSFINGKLRKPESISGRLGHIGEDTRAKTFEDSESVDKTYDRIYDGLSCFGGNLLIPRSTFWNAGGYDENIRCGLEDGDFGLTLWRQGNEFSYDKRTIGYHVWHAIPESRFPPDLRDQIDNLNLKHFGEKDPDHGIIEETKEAFKIRGYPDWQVPPEWERKDED